MDELQPGQAVPEAPTEEEVRKQRLRDNLDKGRATAAANRAAKKKAATEVPHETPAGVKVKSVQVRGALMEIRDGEDHVWTVPAEDDEDYKLHRSIYALKDLPGYEDRFDYQFEKPEDLGPMLTDQWVIVTRKELGLPAFAGIIPGAPEYGASLTGAHMAGGQVCIKKPKVLVDRTRKAFKHFADSIVGQLAPPQDSAKRRLEGQDAIEVEEMKSSTTFKEPQPST